MPVTGQVFAELDKMIGEASPADLPALAGKLAEAEARLRMKMLQPEPTANSPVEKEADPLHRARCLSPEKIAEIIPGLGVSKIREMLRTRRLPGYKEGKCWLVPLVALEEYVSQRMDVATFPRKKLRAVK
jgi:hypothetical protein